jgi:hypothetical protein
MEPTGIEPVTSCLQRHCSGAESPAERHELQALRGIAGTLRIVRISADLR